MRATMDTCVGNAGMSEADVGFMGKCRFLDVSSVSAKKIHYFDIPVEKRCASLQMLGNCPLSA